MQLKLHRDLIGNKTANKLQRISCRVIQRLVHKQKKSIEIPNKKDIFLCLKRQQI